eukprot:TRINITY_DN1932_c0_g1_i13.p1 TRINITY_DN1932_c0_g1~~TRINITY_DN1932_c0_g1_i13.p1  ORF type:complete len:989 (+),score=250.44 TRINITY_DN1932_c0_g1_i13:1104-4070(+)
MTKIAERTFVWCTSLRHLTLHDGITEIGSWAFEGCTSLEAFVVPSAVTKVASSLFFNCFSLKRLTMHDRVTDIGVYAFFNCTSLDNVVVPRSVTKIPESAFDNCRSLENLSLHDGVTEIDTFAFRGCLSMEDFVVPLGVRMIGSRAFYDCASLKTVTLHKDMTDIGTAAFYNCSSLEELLLPPGVVAIGREAFRHCHSLKAVTAVGNIAIPHGPTTISKGAFADCASLKEVVLHENVTGIEANAFERTALESFTMPRGVATVETSLFENCGALRQVYLHDNVGEIGSRAFFNCSRLETVAIPPAVTEIPAEAFKDCLSLTEVHMHDNVTHIDDGAFEGCASLTCVALPPNCTYGEAVFKGCGRLAAYAGDASENMTVVFAGSSCGDGSCEEVAQCAVPPSQGRVGIIVGATSAGLLAVAALLSAHCVWKRRAALTAFGAEWHPDVVSLGREVGRGASGGVLLGTHVHTNAMVAVKTLPAGEHASEQELRMLQTLEHPRLVALWGHHTSPTATTLYMEYMSGGSLAQVVERQGRMHETALRRCVRDAAEGLAFLHGRGVVHRDVKPHNLLVDNGGQVKLADFGCSKDNVGKETLSTGVRGTPHYMAPEVATGLLSSASDMWSLGATAVHLASGRKPWDETGLGPLPLLAYLAQICDGEDVEGDVQPAVPEHLSPGARTSLLRCLSVQRGQRPSAAELLADAFLQDVTEPLPGTEAMANYTENVHPQGAPGLLSGTACVVFADVACGEALWRECAAGMGEGVAVYGKVVRAVAARHRGYEVKTIYDCFMMAFEGAEDGVRFGLEVQRALFDAEWPDALRECAACCDEEDAAAGWNGLRVQVGMDCGAVDVTFNAVMGRYDYFGPTVNRASRTKSQAVPGFVTMTPEVAAAAGSVLPDGVCVFEREGVRMAGIAEPTTLHNAVPEALAGRMAFARLWVAEKGAAESDGAAAASTNPLVVQRRAESVAAHADKSGVAEASDDHDALRTISVA